MNEHTCTLPSDVRGLAGAAHPTSDEIVVISVAEVMLGTAAASTVRPHGALRAWWTRFCENRAERRLHARRRPDYFEHAAMAREMYRL